VCTLAGFPFVRIDLREGFLERRGCHAGSSIAAIHLDGPPVRRAACAVRVSSGSGGNSFRACASAGDAAASSNRVARI